MASSRLPRPLSLLFRDLVVALVLGVALYLVFTLLNHLFLNRFSAVEILLLEAGAIVLIAYIVSRAVTGATNALFAVRGGTRAYAARLFLNLLIAIGAVLALFKLAGVSIESIFLGSALAGIVLGLAAQTVLANVFAGLLLVVADPFRPGDRITVISSSYGAIAPSYPHEMMYPGYTGTVEEVGLIYTTLRLGGGDRARIPNNVVIGALVVKPHPEVARPIRVRMTFPLSIPVAVVESAVARLPTRPGAIVPPRLELADVSAATWDGVIVIDVAEPTESSVRDLVLRSVLSTVAAPPVAR